MQQFVKEYLLSKYSLTNKNMKGDSEMKCRYKEVMKSDIAQSTFTVYNQDGSVLKESATFDEVFSKENVLNLILEATSLPLRVKEN